MEGDNEISGKGHEENWHRLCDSYWQGLAFSARVVEWDISGKKPLGQGDSYRMT